MKIRHIAITAAIVAGLTIGIWTDAQADEHDATVHALDKAHTAVGFSIRHMGIANVRGHFDEYEGEIHYDGENLASLVVTATIQAASINTQNQRRDDHLRSADYFEADTYPVLTFKSTGVVPHGDGHALTGHLTIKEVTREVTLPFELSGPIEDPWGGQRIGISIGGQINRQDFGVAYDAAADRLIGDVVTFDIQIQAVQQ
jgi:polyisoprenoid-binding protein YceI